MNMTNFSISKKSTVETLRATFSDFPRQESPEKDWWIFEREFLTPSDAKERVTVTVSGAPGYVRLIPTAELRFDSIAILDSQIWGDPNRASWHMSAGLKRYLAECAADKGESWAATNTDELARAAANIRKVFESSVEPIFRQYNTVQAVCDWFDQKPNEVLQFVPEIAIATFNVAAKRYARASSIAVECRAKNASLPATENEMTKKIRASYQHACEAVLSIAKNH